MSSLDLTYAKLDKNYDLYKTISTNIKNADLEKREQSKLNGLIYIEKNEDISNLYDSMNNPDAFSEAVKKYKKHLHFLYDNKYEALFISKYNLAITYNEREPESQSVYSLTTIKSTILKRLLGLNFTKIVLFVIDNNIYMEDSLHDYILENHKTSQGIAYDIAFIVLMLVTINNSQPDEFINIDSYLTKQIYIPNEEKTDQEEYILYNFTIKEQKKLSKFIHKYIDIINDIIKNKIGTKYISELY